jgi:hypothetical protein
MLKKLMNEGKLGKMECEKIDKLDNQWNGWSLKELDAHFICFICYFMKISHNEFWATILLHFKSQLRGSLGEGRRGLYLHIILLLKILRT